MEEMQLWIAKHAEQYCYQIEDDEWLYAAVFDWSAYSAVPLELEEIFYDSEAGDFDGFWDGDEIDDSMYVPFALTNASEAVIGAEMGDDLPAQFDSMLLYRRSDGRVFEISVDGTAIPQAGITEIGDVDSLDMHTTDDPYA